MDETSFIRDRADDVLNGFNISFDEAELLLVTKDVLTLAECANEITRSFNADKVDVETLLNAKSGNCPEDCSFCSQSSHSRSGINRYPLLSTDAILEKAEAAKKAGASSFCLVCAYREPPENDFQRICEVISEVRKRVDIDINVSLGFITAKRARKLKTIGVRRYNHNLETSESYFSQICRSHDFQDRVKTARVVKDAGLELCCGGIIGMGESPRQRLELGFSIASLCPEEVPLNILVAQKGTPLQSKVPISNNEIITTIAIWRFIMPKTILKIAGGREVHFSDDGRTALRAGANGLITGGYLTIDGNKASRDIQMIQEIGLHT
jgi:biotin synthase